MSDIHDSIRAVRWQDDGLRLLDQRVLPRQRLYIDYQHPAEVAGAIRDMVVRGAPAIGVAAAYGVVLAARMRYDQAPDNWKQAIDEDLSLLAAARPTAVNLSWALRRMRACIEELGQGNPVPALLAEAQSILDEDIAANRRMGELGTALIEGPGAGVLTHCNTGSLATGGYGTALGVIRSAHAAGKLGQVYADETRPWLQGARLTAWELVQDHIPVTLLVDGAAAHLMRQGRVQWVIVGSDRIAANGDVANKIGTYSAAVNARHHGVKFMVVAPSSTVDMDCPCGDDIPIEMRDENEILALHGEPVAASGATAWNPAFDITPAGLIDAIVTERGVVLDPTAEKMAQMMAS